METAEGPVCVHDLRDGSIKAPEEIFEGGVQFFLTIADGNRELAERLTRKNMRMLPHWQANHFALLDGEAATDAEFGEAMGRL